MKKILIGSLSALLAVALLGVGSHYASAAPPPNAAAVEGLTPAGTVTARPPIIIGGRSSGNVNRTAVADPLGHLITSLDRHGVSAYRFSGSFTPQATAAVTLLTVQGSATKTVRVKRVLVGGVSTANATVPAQLIRSTALGAGGTVVSPNPAKLDTTLAAPTAVVSHYTTSLKAAGTSTGIGPFTSFRLFTSVVTTPTIPPGMVQVFPEPGMPVDSPIILRGTSDFLELQNTNAGNLSAATVIDYAVELEEE